MDKWLNDIRNRLKDYGQEPPQGLWEQLSTRLEQEGLAGKRQHKPAAWMLWPKRIAVAACVAVAVLLGYRYMPDFTQAPELASVGEENASGKAAETIEQSGKKAPETDSPIMARALAGTAQSTLVTKTERQLTALASIPSHGEETAEATAMASVEANEPVLMPWDRTERARSLLPASTPSRRHAWAEASSATRAGLCRPAQPPPTATVHGWHSRPMPLDWPVQQQAQVA